MADGVVRWDALGVGRASWLSGAGRSTPGEGVDPAAGVLLHRVEGGEVRAGDVVATVHSGSGDRIPGALTELAGALEIGGPGSGRGPAGVVLERLPAG